MPYVLYNTALNMPMALIDADVPDTLPEGQLALECEAGADLGDTARWQEAAANYQPPTEAELLAKAKAKAALTVDAATSSAILAGFDYSIAVEEGGQPQSLHFSYDSFDQQNFADTASVAILASSGAEGLPTSVTWNAYDADGGLVRLTLTPATFLTLYTAGALTHKATQMEIGGQRKVQAEAAESLEALNALLAEWGL